MSCNQLLGAGPGLQRLSGRGAGVIFIIQRSRDYLRYNRKCHILGSMTDGGNLRMQESVVRLRQIGLA